MGREILLHLRQWCPVVPTAATPAATATPTATPTRTPTMCASPTQLQRHQELVATATATRATPGSQLLAVQHRVPGSRAKCNRLQPPRLLFHVLKLATLLLISPAAP
jgi:hypothetical protein